jgi:hypothetical protein
VKVRDGRRPEEEGRPGPENENSPEYESWTRSFTALAFFQVERKSFKIVTREPVTQKRASRVRTAFRNPTFARPQIKFDGACVDAPAGAWVSRLTDAA